MRQLTLEQFTALVGQRKLNREVLLQPRWRYQIPIHHKVEFIGEFDALLHYPVPNQQRIKSLIISERSVYFSTCTTKQLLHYRMKQSILDVSLVRRLKEYLHLPNNRELSLCFGNWVAMHLSGVSSSKSADWVALHHVVNLARVDHFQVCFKFSDGLWLELPVQADFETRFNDVCLMSAIEMRAFEYLCLEMGIDTKQLQLSLNVLRQHDARYQHLCRRVTAPRIGGYLELFQVRIIRHICHDEFYEPVTQLFEDSEGYFSCQLKRWRNFN